MVSQISRGKYALSNKSSCEAIWKNKIAAHLKNFDFEREIMEELFHNFIIIMDNLEKEISFLSMYKKSRSNNIYIKFFSCIAKITITKIKR